jgi:type IV pilus assembly protein PilM
MSQRLVAVDIGATAVRVVEGSLASDGFIEVTKVVSVPMSQPGDRESQAAVVHGRIRDPRQVVLALDEALSKGRFRRHGVILAVASTESTLSTRSMPRGLSAVDREGMLRNDTHSLLATHHNDDLALATYTAFPGPTADEVLVAAADRAAVAEQVAVAEAAGCEVRAVDLAAMGLFRALVRTNDTDRDVTALVDLGASKTTVAVRRGQHLRWVRTFEGGGMDITRAVMAATGESFAAADERKRLLQPAFGSLVVPEAVALGYGEDEEVRVFDEDRTSSVEDAFTAAVEGLVDSIAVAVDAARNAGDDPTAVVLAGRSALLKGLPERVFQRVGVTTTVAKPWVRLADTRQLRTLRSTPGAESATVLTIATAAGLTAWRRHS